MNRASLQKKMSTYVSLLGRGSCFEGLYILQKVALNGGVGTAFHYVSRYLLDEESPLPPHGFMIRKELETKDSSGKTHNKSYPRRIYLFADRAMSFGHLMKLPDDKISAENRANLLRWTKPHDRFFGVYLSSADKCWRVIPGLEDSYEKFGSVSIVHPHGQVLFQVQRLYHMPNSVTGMTRHLPNLMNKYAKEAKLRYEG